MITPCAGQAVEFLDGRRGLAIQIRYKTFGAGYGAAEICTDAAGRFEWSMPAGVESVYFGSRTSSGRVRLIDEGSCPRLWGPGDGAARYVEVLVSAVTGCLRGVVLPAAA